VNPSTLQQQTVEAQKERHAADGVLAAHTETKTTVKPDGTTTTTTTEDVVKPASSS
jgi:hypothetical protein